MGSWRSKGVTAAVLLAAACGGDGGGGAGETIVVGMRSDFSGFNSITNSSLYTSEVINYALFTPLIQYDADLQPEPWLAESWTEEGDTAVVFTLRSDVRWHDGQPVTAEDVKWTFDMAKDPASASLIGSAFLGKVASAEVLDAQTIRFVYSEPHAQALEDFWWAPMPRHLLEDIAAADLRNAEFNRNPVGSGPFRFVEWRANDRLVLEPAADFPEALGGPAQARRVVFRIVPEAATLLTELITGGVHVDIPVLPEQASRIESSTDAELHSFPGRTVYFLGWNNEREPFTDPALRRALAMGINRQEIIDALLHGEGELAESTIPPWHPLHPDVEGLAYDPTQAASLLEEAGWTDTDGDQIRERNGQPLAFTLLTSDDALRRAVVEVLQSQLRGLGADVEIRVMEFQTMLAAHKSRDYDAVFTNWVLDNFQMASSPGALFHSDLADEAESTNRSAVRIPELDRLIERGGAATDPDEARQVWADFTRVLQREQPVTFMFWLNELAATRNEVSGVTMDPRGELLTMPQWTLGG
ncbi:MAG: ABC transporter substrate-binding protein [Gemmatimonadota bacterium]